MDKLLEKITLSEEDAVVINESISWEEKRSLAEKIEKALEENEIFTSSGVSINSVKADDDIFSIVYTIDGDWKHDHRFSEVIVEKLLEQEGYHIFREFESFIEDSDTDSYESTHNFLITKKFEGLGEAVEEKKVEVKETETLPPVDLEEPLAISTEDEEIEKSIEINAEAMIVSDAIKDEFDTIDNYKSVIATLASMEEPNEEAIQLLNKIVDEKTIILGMLTAVLGKVDNKQTELMKQGEEKAEEVLDDEEDKKENK